MKTKENSPANPREYSPAETPGRREFPVGQASRLPSSQGRDGSPQPSQDSGATRRHQPSALPPPRLRASAGNLSVLGRKAASAFTLLEVLVAVTVLAMMMTFMFSLLGSSLSLWETGNRRIEAAQTARVGLNIMAKELKNAFAGNMTSFTSNGSPLQNYANFFASPTPPNTFGLGNATVASGSHQIRFIASTSDPSDPLNEIGFQCVYITGNQSLGMSRNRSYLIRKRVASASAPIFIRTTGAAPAIADWNPASGGWPAGSGSWHSFQPIIENCVRLEFNYAYANGNTVQWTTDPNNTPNGQNYSSLPLGVLVSVTVVDSRTAEKIAAISTSDPMASSDSTIQRLLAQGSVTMNRFIPFNRN